MPSKDLNSFMLFPLKFPVDYHPVFYYQYLKNLVNMVLIKQVLYLIKKLEHLINKDFIAMHLLDLKILLSIGMLKKINAEKV